MSEEKRTKRDVRLVLKRLRKEEERLEKELNRVQDDYERVERLSDHLEYGGFVDHKRTQAKMKAILTRYPVRAKEEFLSRGAGMAAVPFAFRESVCATLGASSRMMLMRIADGAPTRKFDGPWSKVAHDIKIRYFNLRMLFEGKDEVSYNEEDIRDWNNSETVNNSKYAICSNLDVLTHSFHGLNRLPNMDKKGHLPTLLRRAQIERLTVMEVSYFDTYLPYISPWYLTSVEISRCKFKSASPLSCWLKKVLENKCLRTFVVYDNSVEEPVQEKDNLEDAVYNLLAKRDEFDFLVHSQDLSYFCISRNDSIADLSVTFVKRYLNYWTSSVEGSFRMRLNLKGSCDGEEEVETIKQLYNFGSDGTLRHASGRAEARITVICKSVVLMLERTFREEFY
uniref:FBD domain-containing protein n=1 Tax=Steinernema glaseri TaxID=37863 RepID=A0A1I7YRB6_9BILA